MLIFVLFYRQNYSVLLDASHRLEEISKDVPETKRRLQSALLQYSDTGKLNRDCEKDLAAFTASRTNSQKQLVQLPFIQDLLEIPTLMDSLARNGLLEEVTIFFP